MRLHKVRNEWKEISNKHGITVYKKNAQNNNIETTRGHTIIDATITKIVWILLDIEHHHEWIDLLKESKLLEKISDTEMIIYQDYEAPGPIQNRDYVFKIQAVTEGVYGNIVVDLQSTEHELAPKTTGIRALLHTQYVLQRIDANKTDITVEVQTDPKGNMPKWMVNLSQRDWPYKTLKSLKHQTDKSPEEPVYILEAISRLK